MPIAKKAGPTDNRGRGRRRGQSHGDLKEEAILARAWDLLAFKSVATITIEELAAGAGISRSTFYFYFDSREAVIRALAEQVADRLIDSVTVPVERGERTPEGMTRSMVGAYMNRWRKEGPVLRAMAPLYETDPEHRAFWDKITGRIADTFAATIETLRDRDHALPGPPSAHDLAVALMAMLWRSGYELSLSPPSKATDERVIDTLTAVCLRAIYGGVPTQLAPGH